MGLGELGVYEKDRYREWARSREYGRLRPLWIILFVTKVGGFYEGLDTRGIRF